MDSTQKPISESPGDTLRALADEIDRVYADRPALVASGGHRHPMQPVIVAKDGVHRFKENAIVRHLLDAGPFDMNTIAMMDFTREDREQFAQLIGYSVSGACDLGYMGEEVCGAALAASQELEESLHSPSGQ